jgi:sec-independent protein translocase protein TatC
MANEKLPFTDHLDELRRRLIICFVAVALGFLISYGFAEEIFQILTRPLIQVLPAENSSPSPSLIFTGLAEGFLTYLKVALLAGLFLAAPVIFYELWKFVAPGLYRQEKRYVLPFVLLSTIFFVGGALFGYFIVFPIGFQFFIKNFTTEFIKPLPSIKEYLSFSTKLLLAFGTVFELPLFIFFLSRIGVVDAKSLSRQRKYAILIIFVAAATITPPDVISQLMMAGPLIVLYEVGIIVARLFGKKSVPATADEQTEE